ncbi:hypothetical protein JTE90_015312 [Oedothorax gibbosus]|uniref:Uncharacterized protein n=1 Tax=Oedothorax gibbosus TaxID=931172 RepID=A0AAV6VQA6_9ARAC|nr:hypothetical protein JTE90_015312 [Oedothorax gibbosus]
MVLHLSPSLNTLPSHKGAEPILQLKDVLEALLRPSSSTLKLSSIPLKFISCPMGETSPKGSVDIIHTRPQIQRGYLKLNGPGRGKVELWTGPASDVESKCPLKQK